MTRRRAWLGTLAAGLTLPVPGASQRRPPAPLPLVILDPGHGGHDPGALGPTGIVEKHVTLAMALATQRLLLASRRCRVALTRTGNSFVPLAERVAFARRGGAALLLSLHADSAPEGLAAGARGASVYTLSASASDALAAALARRENRADFVGGLRLPAVPPEVEEILMSLISRETRAGSERLARHLVTTLDATVPLLSNPHRRAAFVVLKAPDVPSALVELGFLSDPVEATSLARPAGRARLAQALARAVLEFLG